MNETTISSMADATAQDILTRHAPDCLDRAALRLAIARLARQGIENSVRLYQAGLTGDTPKPKEAGRTSLCQFGVRIAENC